MVPPLRPPTAAVLLHGGPAEGPDGPLAVLVLAEQPAPRHLLAEGLRLAGHRVSALGEVGEAIEWLHREPCDALVASFRLPAPRLIGLVRRLRALPPPLGRLPVLGLAPQANPLETRECHAAGVDLLLTGAPASEEIDAALRRAVTACWGPGPLNADLRATLAASLAPGPLAERDEAALGVASRLVMGLRDAPSAEAVREGAEAVAAALAPIGALAAPAAARALAAEPARRNALLPPLLSAMVALRTALRRARARQEEDGSHIRDPDHPNPPDTEERGP